MRSDKALRIICRNRMAGNGDKLSEMLERDVREERRSELHQYT
jgi:hypothetical protein